MEIGETQYDTSGDQWGESDSFSFGSGQEGWLYEITKADQSKIKNISQVNGNEKAGKRFHSKLTQEQ